MKKDKIKVMETEREVLEKNHIKDLIPLRDDWESRGEKRVNEKAGMLCV